MAYFTFHGGIELRDRKERTKNLPIQEVLPGKYLVFPMMYEEKPLVFPGEYVLTGQILARAEGTSGSRIHSSVSGIVRSVEKRMTSHGKTYESIIIENDEKYKEIDFGEFVEADEMENRQILARIMNAGILDRFSGGMVYPKLDIKEPQKIRHIIVNCTECEPYLTARNRLSVERPEWIVEGLRVLLKLFPNAKGILAVENDHQEAITALQKILADSRNMKLIPVKRKYPQDTERMLIYTCTGKAINFSKSAEDARCIILDSDAVYAICNAVSFGKPVYKRLMTLSGECFKQPKNVEVFIGTLLSELAAKEGELSEMPDQVICGGPMTGALIEQKKGCPDGAGLSGLMKETLNLPVTKDVSAILCLKKSHRKKSSGMCIGCGYCVDVCNEQLLPVRLAKAAVAGEKEQFMKLGGMECCECGSCSYICPAERNLSGEIKKMKQQIISEKES